MRTAGRPTSEELYGDLLNEYYLPKQLAEMSGKCLKTIYLRLANPKWGGCYTEYGVAITKENYEKIWKPMEILMVHRGYVRKQKQARTKSLRIL